MGADGVAVIVSRWFGGTLLGPDRFKFISNAARRLLEAQGVGGGHGGGKQQHVGGVTTTKQGKVS
jgi:putative IMPACT (imprinted ancient) family translation regulator